MSSDFEKDYAPLSDKPKRLLSFADGWYFGWGLACVSFICAFVATLIKML